MKIGVLTFHSALNFGAVLQLYALQAYIQKHFNDVTVETVDYVAEELKWYYSVRRCFRFFSPKTWIITVHFLIKRHIFRKFVHKHIKVTPQRYSFENIASLNKEFGSFIVGSDQVWNPSIIGNDLNYFLSFSSPQKRFSYAASIGVKDFGEKKEAILSELQLFNRISVREIDAKNYLDSLNLPNVRVDIDPTLLLSKEEWNDIEICRYDKRNYVLAFNVQLSRDVIERAVELGENNNLEVIYVGPYINEKRVKYIPFPEVGELVNLFHHAQYVVTNSFHGTVFSIIYKRRFSVQTELTDGRNSRIQNLLDMLNLSSRINCSQISSEIDWNTIDKLLQFRRQEARNYLEEAVSDGVK